MPVPFIMPKVDMDQETGTIQTWLKREGDPVQADEAVMLMETDKIAIEVPAPATGILAGLRYAEGATVPVTEVIGYILKEGETLADLPRSSAPAVVPSQAPPPTRVPTSEPASEPVRAAASEPVRVVSATPVAVRMARELGVDLAQVPAARGKLTREDVQRYLESQKASAGQAPRAEHPRNGQTQPARTAALTATPAARRLAKEAGLPLGAIPGTGPEGRIQARDVQSFSPPGVISARTERPADIAALTGMRQTIAERMQASFQEMPHIALTVEVDVTALEALRTQLNGIAQRQGEGKLTMTALLVRIVAWALARHPYLNASLIDGQLHLWKDVNVGVATALPEGLIVPVIHGADRMGLREIADRLQDVTTRAKEGRLGMADIQHGTFTISNLGMFGIRQFRAIINPPECAILAVGSVVRKPVVVNEQDEIGVRPIMSLTLSADHRVVDGVVAARFLSELVQVLEAPSLVLY